VKPVIGDHIVALPLELSHHKYHSLKSTSEAPTSVTNIKKFHVLDSNPYGLVFYLHIDPRSQQFINIYIDLKVERPVHTY